MKNVLVPEIQRHGFERIPGPWFSFARKLPDGREQIVDVEHPSHANYVAVTLQETDPGGSRRQRRLADFAGLRDYELGSGSAEEIARVVTEAADHFGRYGLRWFEDPGLQTPATRALEAQLRDDEWQRHIQHGREQFKRGEYAAALDAFRAAEAIKPLDPTTQKFREIALKK